ncbi:hypothetical protein RN001_002687 [Aquatica leii]|uniref:Uncharacterized protein n=1 Tax=Aquatica leii TaxID=1421715 RepID=A0AAN7PQ58_9COLE|nr:hypothetical protein RN001_002687 [Aquatica leii]
MGEQDDSQEEENEVETHEEILPNTEESESEKEETEFLDDEDYQPETKVKVELESRSKPSRRRQPPGYLSDYLTDLMNEDVHGSQERPSDGKADFAEKKKRERKRKGAAIINICFKSYWRMQDGYFLKSVRSNSGGSAFIKIDVIDSVKNWLCHASTRSQNQEKRMSSVSGDIKFDENVNK